MSKKIVIFGSSCNPPGHHRPVVEALTRYFDEVIVVPCGPRPDKLSVTDVDPIHRAVMTDLAFRGIPRVRVDLFDLESASYTPTCELDRRYSQEGVEVWHYAGADLVQPGSDGCSAIEREWQRGQWVWEHLRFAVGCRPGYVLPKDRLPRHSRVVDVPLLEGSSTDIRERAFRRQPLAGLASPDVIAYIERYNLYRGARPSTWGAYPIERPRLLLEKARNNPRADALEQVLAPYVDTKEPNVIVALGGDGTMLRAIRQYWQRRLPFVGFNAGHLGFLHNEPEHANDVLGFFARMRTYHLPLLRVDSTLADGNVRTDYAFNDAWIERDMGFLSAQVWVNGRIRVERLVSDTILAASPAGSTAYARVMGATPMNLDRPGIVLAASAVDRPRGWRQVELPGDADVEFRLHDHPDRPRSGRACFDDVKLGSVGRMRIRTSRIASVELGFGLDNDLAEKRIAIQFPD